MRGGGDYMRIGERVAFYRARRGMTQRTLAELVGRSEDWLSKIERGVREIRRIDVASELARALRVELSDLLGQPVLAEDDNADDNVPAIRDALMTPHRLSRTLFRHAEAGTGVEPDQVARFTDQAWSNYQRGRLGRVVADLPKLIATGQNLEDAATHEDRRGWAVSARIHHLAVTTLSKIDLGDIDHVIRNGPAVSATDLPVERQVSHMIDVARALGLAAHDEDATNLLLDAEQLAPPLVRHDPIVRETVKSLYRRARASNNAINGLAERCRAIR